MMNHDNLESLRLISDEELSERYAAALAELGIETEEQARRVLDIETAELIEELSRIEVVYPLAAAVLWVREDAPWDQRRIAMSLVYPLSLVIGGNRSGKTFAILELLVAFALGGDHPAVRAWVQDNDLPDDLVPDGPGECYAVAETAGRSMVLHREPICKLLPDSAVWYGFNSNDEAKVEIPVPGYQTVARIRFKSCSQGHGSYKGHSCRMVAISEEPPDADEGRLIIDECMRGCATVGGRVVLEATLQNGITWVHDDLIVARKYDCQLIKLNTDHNVMLPDYDSVQRWLGSLSPEEQRMRRLGEIVPREGLVYSRWSRSYHEELGHICKPFDIPADWPRFRTHDWGQTLKNGTACLWHALAPDGTRYVYREYYLAGEPSFQVHAANVRAMQPADELMDGSWGDHEPDAIEAFAAVGLQIAPADKTVQSGISRVETRMLAVGGRVRLKVFDTCEGYIREIENYRRDPRRRDNAPIKKNDHLMDCDRYAENGIAAWQGVSFW